MSRLAETHRRSLEEPEDFWREAAAAIDWHRADVKLRMAMGLLVRE